MRPGLLVVAVVFALPARGEGLATELTLDERHALTAIDIVVTPEVLDGVLQAPDDPQRIARLKDIALSTEDLGVRLRAIRALPHYCSATCRSDGVSTGDPAHLAVRRVLQSLDSSDHSGPGILKLHATLEALGATKSGLTQDVSLIAPFLGHSTGDVRATAARALTDMCNPAALDPLRDRLPIEPVEQVRLAISAALRDLDQCGN